MDRVVDERGLRELVVRSDDLHADAMRQGRVNLKDYTEAAQEARAHRQRRLAGAGVLIAGATASAVLGTSRAALAASEDVQVLQTAAALENLAVSTYKTALTLPFIGGSSANGVVKAFSTKTMAQHSEHAKAFNAAVKALGGKEQNDPDAKYAAIVKAAVPGIKGAADVVKLAVTLEDVATQTYVKNVSLVSTSELRQLFASVAGVEAQHKAILLAVQALLAGDAEKLIKLPPDGAKLPAAAGSVGFPDAFFPTTKASPPAEGAVK